MELSNEVSGSGNEGELEKVEVEVKFSGAFCRSGG